jgi:hypothetical protein
MFECKKMFRLIAVTAVLAASLSTTGCAGFGDFMLDLATAMEQQDEAPRRDSSSSAPGMR